MELFGPYEPIHSLGALLGDFRDFDFGPETEFSTLTEMINFQFFSKLRGRWIFLGVSRGVLTKTLRLSYRLSNLVVWVSQKFSIIKKNNSSLKNIYLRFSNYWSFNGEIGIGSPMNNSACEIGGDYTENKRDKWP